MDRAVSGLSPVIMTVWMPILRSSANRSAIPGLTTSDSRITPRTTATPSASSATHQRRAAVLADPVDHGVHLVGHAAAVLGDPVPDRTGRALADLAVAEVDAGHPGLRGERHELGGLLRRRWRSPRAGRTRRRRGRRCCGLPACRRPGWTAGPPSASSFDRGRADRDQLGGPPVAEGDGAGLVQQQRVHVARGLDGAAGHGEHVALHQPVHAGDADRGQQRADRRRDQADQQRGQHDHRLQRCPSNRPSAAARRPRAGR